jgi:hypothetical protein
VSQAVRHRFSFEEYLRVEEDSGLKHEFFGGSVYAMSGGTPEHAGITANLTVSEIYRNPLAQGKTNG